MSRVGVEILLTTATAKRVVAPFVEAHPRVGLYLENAATDRAGELGSDFRTLGERGRRIGFGQTAVLAKRVMRVRIVAGRRCVWSVVRVVVGCRCLGSVRRNWLRGGRARTAQSASREQREKKGRAGETAAG